ncbi:MAG: hypothetical protein KA140_02740 [Caldisericia bacterium]|nr:hypothetical protein [Caldisericia bacterium]
MIEFLKKYSSLLISVVGFIVLCIAAYTINASDGKLTWFWGTMAFFAIWPVEASIFTFVPKGFLQHLSGALIGAGLLILMNFLQVHAISPWCVVVASSFAFWPLGYIVWSLMMKVTKSNILSALVGWIVISAIAIGIEYVLSAKLSWSLPFAVYLAFWPAASFVFKENPETSQKRDSVQLQAEAVSPETKEE